jgi:hypothetical protein
MRLSMGQEYVAVYDVRQAGYTDWIPIAIGGVILVTFLCAIALTTVERIKARLTWIAAAVCTAAVLFLTVSPYVEYRQMLSALAQRRAVTIEGVVTDLSPGDEGGHVPEWFTVSGHRFTYSRSDDSPGFTRVRGVGGPIREGQRVRILEVNDRIARLEIAASR